MNYLVLAIVALIGYTFVPPLMSLATQDVPSDVATFGVASMLAVTSLALSLVSREPVLQHLTSPSGTYVVLAGGFLTVSILAFFRALSAGPVSVVVPVFGLFLVTSSLVGVLILGEDLTLPKIAGSSLALLAIIVLSLE